MARRYSFSGQDTNTAATTIMGLVSAATIRPGIYDLIFGSDATPADMAAEYVLQRFTAAGTSTAGVINPLDPADPASLCPVGTTASGTAHSAEPTYTANAIVLMFACNQRATFRWVAAPESELILPATAANGLGLQVISVAGTPVNVNSCMHFVE